MPGHGYRQACAHQVLTQGHGALMVLFARQATLLSIQRRREAMLVHTPGEP